MRSSIKVLVLFLVVGFFYAGQSFAAAKEAVPPTEAAPPPITVTEELYKAEVAKVPEPYELVIKWGNYGQGDGQFNEPYSATVDSAGNVYVADTKNDRIQKFTSDGTFLTKWGSEGTGDGQFKTPSRMAVDSAGNIYVADSKNDRIQKFTSDGTFLTKWGSKGSGDGQFEVPYGVAVDSAGNVYVADTYNHRIQKFNSDGTFLTKWGSMGSGDGQFIKPWDLAVDPYGNVYVAAPLKPFIDILPPPVGGRIQKFDSNGTFLTKWGSEGTGDGQFNDPWGIAVDSYGNVYVADRRNNRIQKFTSNGTFVTKWGSQGSGDSQFRSPRGVAVDSDGYIYVADTVNHRIQKFKKKWGFVAIAEEELLVKPPTTHYCLVKVCSGGLYEYESFRYADDADDILTDWETWDCVPINNATVQISWGGELIDLHTDSDGLTKLFEQPPNAEIKISKLGYKSVVFNLPPTKKKYVGIWAGLKEKTILEEQPLVPATTTTTTIPIPKEFVPVTTTTTTTLGIRRFR